MGIGRHGEELLILIITKMPCIHSLSGVAFSQEAGRSNSKQAERHRGSEMRPNLGASGRESKQRQEKWRVGIRQAHAIRRKRPTVCSLQSALCTLREA